MTKLPYVVLLSLLIALAPGAQAVSGDADTREQAPRNNAPYVPGPPYTEDGVYSHALGTTVTYCAVTTSPDGRDIQYVFNWGDGSGVTNSPPGWKVPSGEPSCAEHAWSMEGQFCVTAYAQNWEDPIRGVSDCRTETVAPPSDPAPYIPGRPYTKDGHPYFSDGYHYESGQPVVFCAQTTSPGSKPLQYIFKWGDGSEVGKYPPEGKGASGVEGCATHTWPSTGRYCVTVYAQDWENPIRGESACSYIVLSGNDAPTTPYWNEFHDSVQAHTFYRYCAYSTDPESDDMYFVIDWGDGTIEQSGTFHGSGQYCVSHAWARGGSHWVTVQAKDVRFGDSPKSQPREVRVQDTNHAPIASFTWTANGLAVDFDTSTSRDPDGNPITKDIDFGDGTAAYGIGSVVRHTYACEGPFKVVLTVRDVNNVYNDQTQNVALSDPVDGDQDRLPRCREAEQGTSDGVKDSDDDGIWDLFESASWPDRRKVYCPNQFAPDDQCRFPHPTERDLYVEVDWYEGLQLSADNLRDINAVYAGAPFHFTLDAGQLGGGQNLGQVGTGGFDDVWARSNDPDSFSTLRHGIFRYGVMTCGGPVGIAGEAQTPGSRFAVYRCTITNDAAVVVAFLHELGHNLLGYRENHDAFDPSHRDCETYVLYATNHALPSHFSYTPARDCDGNGEWDHFSHSVHTSDAMNGAGAGAAAYDADTWQAMQLDMGIGPKAPSCGGVTTGDGHVDSILGTANPCRPSHVDVFGPDVGGGVPPNAAPGTPAPPSGPTDRVILQDGEYCTSAMDPEGDPVGIVFNWGDNSHTPTGLAPSGSEVCARHAWATGGTYCVRAASFGETNPTPGTWSACLNVRVR